MVLVQRGRRLQTSCDRPSHTGAARTVDGPIGTNDPVAPAPLG